MGGSTGIGIADECLVGIGYASGVCGVVRRFGERIAALQELALRWRPGPPQGAALEGDFAVHPNGLFVLQVGGSGDGFLHHVWPGMGRRVVGIGNRDNLQMEALRIVRQGGPFGGPPGGRTGEQIVRLPEPHGGMRRPLPDGSEVRTLLVEQRILGVRIWPDGKFAQMPMVSAHDDPGKMIDDDAEHLSIGSARTPWIFTDLHPLVGMIRAEPYDLLLCALRVDLVGLLAVKGEELLEVKVGTWAEIRKMDAGSWLADAASRPSSAKTRASGAATQESPAGDTKAAESPSAAKGEDDSAGSGSAAAGKDKGPAGSNEKPSPKRKRVGTSPAGMPGPRERRVRLEQALASAITRHLASVAAELPAGALGAAFAVELLRALEAAALSDHPTLTGKMVELFSRLHKKGFLSTIPADQAGRAALKLLAERTPLVRRFHYRRWGLVFADVHNPASELRARLGPLPTE